MLKIENATIKSERSLRYRNEDLLVANRTILISGSKNELQSTKILRKGGNHMKSICKEFKLQNYL
jgi:hypothetical protein